LSNSSGTVSKAGTWSFTGAAAGTAASFRLYTSGAVCFMQGDVTATGGGGVMEIDNTFVKTDSIGAIVDARLQELRRRISEGA
jgi:hypothetical protein